MTNQSIYAAFERMWQHVLTRLGNKADANHTHDDLYYTESEIDSKLSEVNTSLNNITTGNTVVKEAEHAANADHATLADSATKATQDGNGNVIANTYETKSDATTKFNNAKTYIDEEIATLASNVAYIDENDNETVTLSVDLQVLSSLVGGDV